MNRKELLQGVHYTSLPGEKYKRTRISLYFITKSNKQTATAHALLPMVLERGYEGCPDMTELSKKLAHLYGAGLSMESAVIGENRVLAITVSGIKDAYALQNEPLTAEYLDILFGVAFHPVLKNGAFVPEEVEIEKQKLKEVIQSEINNKRLYCVRQAQRVFFEDSTTLGAEKNGYLEEVDGITPEALYNVYKEMLATAQIEIFVTGNNDATIETRFIEATQASRGLPYTVQKTGFEPRTETKVVAEPIDAEQGKLCLMFTLGEPLLPEEESIMRVAVSVFGASPTSRLFMNVREKQSLCYYCAAGFSARTASLTVDSGVEFANAQKTIDAILHELNDLIETGPTEEELAFSKMSLINALNAVEDSAAGTESWYFSEEVFSNGKTPQSRAEEIEKVTAEQVQNVLGRLSLSVQYVLTKEGV